MKREKRGRRVLEAPPHSSCLPQSGQGHFLFFFFSFLFSSVLFLNTLVLQKKQRWKPKIRALLFFFFYPPPCGCSLSLFFDQAYLKQHRIAVRLDPARPPFFPRTVPPISANIPLLSFFCRETGDVLAFHGFRVPPELFSFLP